MFVYVIALLITTRMSVYTSQQFWRDGQRRPQPDCVQGAQNQRALVRNLTGPHPVRPNKRTGKAPRVNIHLDSIQRYKKTSLPQFNGWRATITYTFRHDYARNRSKYYSLMLMGARDKDRGSAFLNPTSFSTTADPSEMIRAPSFIQRCRDIPLAREKGKLVAYIPVDGDMTIKPGSRISVVLLEEDPPNKISPIPFGVFISNTLLLPSMPK